MSGALWQRIKKDGHNFGLDPRLTTELGRLNWFAELSTTQVAAGFRMAEIYGRYERFKRLRRAARSPSYEHAFGDADVAEELMLPEELKLLEKRVKDATIAFERLNGKEGVGGLIPSRLRAALEQLCCENRAINPAAYDEVRVCLDRLAAEFGITRRAEVLEGPSGRESGGAHRSGGPPLHFNNHMEETEKTTVKPPNIDRIFWIQVARKLRPDLTEEQLGQAYDIMIALRDREKFRRDKSNVSRMVR